MITEAGVPVHLRVHSWAMQASMTQLFAQVIPGLGFLSGSPPAIIIGATQISQPGAMVEEIQYTPIPPEGSMMVPAGLFSRKQVRSDGTANCPIYLRNDTDSGISSISHSTLMKTPGGKCQPLVSTPKTKPKLLVTAQQQWNELAAMMHMSGLSKTRRPGPGLGAQIYLVGNQPHILGHPRTPASSV